MLKIFWLIFLLFLNCVSVKVNPNLEELSITDRIPKLEGKLLYNGNPEYLPNIIRNNINKTDIIKYYYTIRYEPLEPSDLTIIFNPLIFIGFPIEIHKVIIKGTLSFNEDKKYFFSEVMVSQPRSLFINPNYSNMRRIGLIELKKNIEQQYQIYQREN